MLIILPQHVWVPVHLILSIWMVVVLIAPPVAQMTTMENL